MPLIDIFAGSKRETAMRDTWGHIFPEPGSKHTGVIVIATGNSCCTVLGSDFGDLGPSPQRQNIESGACDLFDLDWDDVCVYEIHCTLHFYKDESRYWNDNDAGRIIKTTIKRVYVLPV